MFWVGFSQEKLINHRNLRLPEGLSKMHTRWICPLHNMELSPQSGKMFSLLKFSPKCVWWAETGTAPCISHRGKSYTCRRFPGEEVVLPSDREERDEPLPTPLLHTSVPVL